MVKLVVIDSFGIMIGDVEEKDGKVQINRPLQISPSQQGFALSENPLFSKGITTNPAYIIAEGEPGDALTEKYNNYVITKNTGIVMPGSPQMKL